MTKYDELREVAARIWKSRDWLLLRSFFHDPADRVDKCLLWCHLFLPEMFRDESPEFHRDLVGWLLNDKNEYVAAPRGHAKTSVVQGVACFIAANQLEKFCVIIEKSYLTATEVLSVIREAWIDNSRVLTVYGKCVSVDSSGETVLAAKETQADVLINGVRFRAMGFETPIRGIKAGAYRPTWVVLDDIETDEAARSEEQRVKYTENFTRGVLPALDINGRVKMVGTILHEDSLLNKLIRAHSGHLLKAYDPAAEDPQSTLLWPERWSWEKLQSKRAEMEAEGLGTAAFCNPYEAPILMADFTFKPIGEVKEGDNVIGFTFDDGKRRRLVKTTVKKTFSRLAKTVNVFLSNGDVVRCTPEHRWFTGRYTVEQGKYKRKCYAPATVGSRMMKVLSLPKKLTFEEALDYRYLGGMIDGEGACKYGSIQICQSPTKNPEVYAEIEHILNKLKISFKVFPPCSTKTSSSFVLRGGRQLKAEIIWYTGLAKSIQLVETILKEPQYLIKEKPHVTKIEDFGEETVYALETETGNYVAWGYASSNSQEFLNEPIDASRRTFMDAWLVKRFRPDDLKFKALNCIACIDAAQSISKNADWTAVTVVKWDAENNWYIAYAKREKVGIKGLVDLVFRIQQRFEPQILGVEKNAMKDQLMPLLKEQMEQRRLWPNVVELQPRGRSKEARILGALQGRFESGKIWFMDGANDDQGILRGELRDFPMGKNDDLCLVAGTRIATEFGDKNIEDIHVGDRVVTPLGLRKVIAAEMTGLRAVVSNVGLRGTWDHPVFQNDGAFDALAYADYNSCICLNLSTQIRWTLVELLSLMEKHTNSWEGKANIIWLNQQSIEKGSVLRACMLQFMNMLMGLQFRRAFTFITRIVIRLIITLKIWSLWKLGNIFQSMSKSVFSIQYLWQRLLKTWREYDRFPQNGMGQKKGLNGIQITAKNNGNLEKWRRLLVLFVQKNLILFGKIVQLYDFAPQAAGRSPDVEVGSIMRGDLVLSVPRNLLSTNTQKIKHAAEFAEINLLGLQRERVYNLTVERDHVYFANGILVGNCDALAYVSDIGSRPFSSQSDQPTSLAEKLAAKRKGFKKTVLSMLG